MNRECGRESFDPASATEAAGRVELFIFGSHALADGGGLGRPAAEVVYAIASAMEDAGEFDSVHVRADDSAGGVGKRRRARARSVSGAVECELDALRTDVHGDVCDSPGGRGGVAQIAAGVAGGGFGW